MIGDDIEEAARRFACVAHGGQTYGGAPYSVHLATVRDVLGDFGFSGDLGVAAWPHDVLEDTSVTRAELEGAFGVGVAELVWAVTGIGGTREERNSDIYAKIAGCPLAVILKLADRIANVEASAGTRWFAMYASEQQGFRAYLGPILDGEKAVGRMWARLEGALAMNSREATVRQVLERWRGREAPDGDSIVFADGTLVTMSLVQRRFQQPGVGFRGRMSGCGRRISGLPLGPLLSGSMWMRRSIRLCTAGAGRWWGSRRRTGASGGLR